MPAWRHHLLRTALAIPLLCVFGISPSVAGDWIVHLLGTGRIASILGMNPTQTQQIAIGNQSLDENYGTDAATPGGTTATLFGLAALGITKPHVHSDNGSRWHCLASTREDAFNCLDTLNALANEVLADPRATDEAKNVAVGQYLHAYQDVFFHQDTKTGAPFPPYGGHFDPFLPDLGREQDKIPNNFRAAVRAFDKTSKILDYYKNNKKLPPIEAKDREQIYSTITESPSDWESRLNSQVQDIRKKNPAMYRLAEELQNAYRVVDYRNDPSYQNPSNPTSVAIRNPTFSADDDYEYIPVADFTQKFAWLPTYVPDLRNKNYKSYQYYNYEKGPQSRFLLRPAKLPTLSNPGVTPVSQSTITGSTPGGISLSTAAAARLSLNLNLDGLHMSKGRLVLSGRIDGQQKVDAALLFTAMRLACEADDPFFSLDPDNGAAWSAEGERASAALWPRIRADYGLDDPLKNKPAPGLTVRALSASRDYRQLWSTLAPQYPNLKSRLVFRPEWLRHTRFGEIMYKADVLLKELDGGVPTLRPDPALRAGKVDRFTSATMRSAVQQLLSVVDKDGPSPKPEFKSSRLWFDVAPQAGGPQPEPAVSMLDDDTPPKAAVSKSTDPAVAQLRAALVARGLKGVPVATGPSRAVAVKGDVVDLSQVYPQMFVRAHDHATGKDVAGTGADLIALSDDINHRIKQYVDAYEELRSLTDIFRLYVAAVAFTKRDPGLCANMSTLPLLPAEKVRVPMPEFHPTELYFVFATYVQVDAQGSRHWWFGSSASRDGGVSARGKEFYQRESATERSTPVINEIQTEVSNTTDHAAWKGKTDRTYVGIIPGVEAEFAAYVQRQQSFKPFTQAMFLAQIGESMPAAKPARGMLDDPVAGPLEHTDRSRGMLDDIDPGAGGVHVIPGRR